MENPRRLLDSGFDEQWPVFSNDGNWLAYQSNESGRDEIYVTPYPAGGRGRLVSTRGGEHPLWSRSENELYYHTLDRSVLMSVRIGLNDGLPVGLPTKVLDTGNIEIWDVTGDDQRFLGVEQLPWPEIHELRVVFNWFEELKRLAPPPEAN